MATPIIFNGVNYSVPGFGDVGYAQGPGNLSAYLIAIATGTLQTTGGLFSLTSDINFGPNFGLISLYYKSASANIATAGVLRLANTDTIDWRNFANTTNLALGVNTSDQLTYNGVVISGNVTSGLQFQIPYYATNGNALSPAANIHYNAAGDFEVIGGHNVVFDGLTSGAVSMKATAITTPYTFTLPANAGTNNFFLQTNGSGTTTWAAAGGAVTLLREDYIVGTPLNNYTGSLTVFNLTTSYTVGGKAIVVTLDGDVQTPGATADYIETNSTTITFNNALVVGERVSFIWSQTAGISGGTVNPGTLNQLAFYAATGSAVSGTPALTTTGSVVTATVPLAMSANKITSVANGTAATDAAAFGQIKIIQIVTATTNTLTTVTNSATFSDVVSIAITPTSASNRVFIVACAPLDNTAAAAVTAYMTLRRGSTNLATGATGSLLQLFGNAAGTIGGGGTVMYLDSPATTSSTTYNLSIAGNGGTGSVRCPANGGTAIIVVMEVV